jgi:hypothetical protein
MLVKACNREKPQLLEVHSVETLKLLLPYMQQRYIGEVVLADGSRAAAAPNRNSWSVVGWTVGPAAVPRYSGRPEHVAQKLLLQDIQEASDVG